MARFVLMLSTLIVVSLAEKMDFNFSIEPGKVQCFKEHLGEQVLGK